tara:strand:- start:2072 stop:2242 length:171 start_codon:yes stop_codon:yes gene_type:complete
MFKNPQKTMIIISLLLVIASIAMNLFWNKKVNLATGEVGYFGIDPKEEVKETKIIG